MNRIIELEGHGKKWWWPNFRYYPDIFLEELRKPSKNINQDSWSPVRDLKLLNTKLEC
jgi:hypothetical protein